MSHTSTHPIRWITRLIGVYVVATAATLLAVAILAALGSDQATAAAWWHEAIVAVFAVVLPLRLRAARRGSPRALGAIGLIAGVLVAVNVVEASIPDFLPSWMRIEMGAVAILMAAVAILVVRARRR